MSKITSFEEEFISRYWPADPFNGIWVFSSKLSFEAQINCAAGQYQIDLLRQSESINLEDLESLGNCWKVSQIPDLSNFSTCLCCVSQDFANRLTRRNQLATEYIAAKIRGYHGNQQRVMVEAQKDSELGELIYQINELFTWMKFGEVT